MSSCQVNSLWLYFLTELSVNVAFEIPHNAAHKFFLSEDKTIFPREVTNAGIKAKTPLISRENLSLPFHNSQIYFLMPL